MQPKNIYIIEDDREISQLLEIHLKDLGWQVKSFSDGLEGYETAAAAPPDLIILDIMLPSMDGIEVCQKLRAQNHNFPIIMLTARSEEIDRVLGLEIGADDYMTKPFSVREFLARVKAIFRRSRFIKSQLKEENKAAELVFEELSIDIERRKVLLLGRVVDLSPKEFELLVLMASNPGKSYNRARLLNLIWGYDFQGYEHTVNSHINRLRAKIEPDMASPKFILTTWGIGYKFNEDLSQT